MKSKTSLLTFLGIGLLIFSISCKKFDTAQEPNEAMENSYEEKFFNSHRTSDSKENAIVNYVKRINEKEKFVNNAVKQIGFPRWDKITLYTSKYNINSFASSNDSTHTYFVPFVRDSQNFVNASLIIVANPSDTTFRFRYNWQYLQMQNTPNSVLDSAENFAIMFMRLDKAVFGYKKFSITDNNLFKRNGKNAIHVELRDSVIQNNLYEQVTCTSITITYNDCYAPDSDECSGGCDGCWFCTAAIHITSCTEGSGGGSSGGSGIPTGGGPTGNGGCSGCGGGGQQGPSGNSGGGGWQPVVYSDEPIHDVTDSIPNILSRACSRQADSVFNWGLQNNNREQSFILVKKNDSIYPKNFTSGVMNGDKTRVNYTLAPGETLLCYFHTHPLPTPQERGSFSPGDFIELTKNRNIPGYTAILECGDVRYAFVIEDLAKLNIFTSTRRNNVLVPDWENAIYSQPNFYSNTTQACINGIIQYLGSASTCGVGFYKATAPNKNNFVKLNP
jgi:hypothetical protein